MAPCTVERRIDPVDVSLGCAGARAGASKHAAELWLGLRMAFSDWGRYDTNQDHVCAKPAFTRRLDELGIDHAAEEYRGNQWNESWTDESRPSGPAPFFDRHLAVE